MGLSTSLGTAIAGLNATQVGIGIVANNVSNADKPGYVRRVVSTNDTVAGQTISTSNSSVQRLLDKIVQRQLWQESSGAAYTATRANSLSSLDKLYGAPGSTTALDSMYSSFTSSLQALQNDPSSYSTRTAVLDTANALATRLNALSNGVQTLRSQAESGIAAGVTRVNDLLAGLTKVNASIVGSPNDSAKADLLDQRDRVLAELSQYVDIRTDEDARGSLTITTSSGVQLFDGQPAVRFAFDARGSIGANDTWDFDPAKRGVGTITMTSNGGNSSDAIANNIFRSGEIAALVELRDKTLVQSQAQLDEIAAQMSSALSDRELNGTVTGTSPTKQVALAFDLSNLERGNSLTFDYKATSGGATQRFTFVNVAAGTTIPPSARGDAANQVIGIDFDSASPAAIQTALNTALGPNFTASYDGTTISIAEAGGSIVGMTARPTNTTLVSGSAEVPLFKDGVTSTVYTGSFEGGSQTVGYAGRIAVNPAILNDRSKLVTYAAGTLQGDPTRPGLMLDRLTNSQRAFTRSATTDSGAATTTGTVSNLVQRVVTSQGQAVEAASRLNEGQQVALAAVQSRFQETSQVNVDQEMSTLIELQTAYAANARIISTVKEMMDTLLRI